MELRWPLCTGWTLGWCRLRPMPVSVQSYECCPVVVGWCLMPCHTQCNHSQTWNEQWHGTASRVYLCPLPISSERPLGWGWEPPCTVSSAHWCASEMRGASPTTDQGTSWTPPLAEVCFQSSQLGDLWARDRGAVKCMTLHLWAANLKAFLVAHSCMAFTACCRCLFMVSREGPRKQIARSSTKSALKMSLAIQEGSSLIFSPKHL